MAAVPTLVSAGAVNTGGIPAFGQPTTAGNLLVAVVAAGNNSNSIINDPTWTEVTAARATAAAAAHTQIFYKEKCAASELAPGFTNTSFAQLSEWTLTGASAFTFILDQAGAAVDQASGGNVTAAAADKNPAGNNLVITADFWRIVAALDTTSDSYNNGATATNLANNDGTNTNNHYRFSYGVTTGNGSADKNTVTYSVAITHSAYSLATFRPVVQLAPSGVTTGQAFGLADLLRLLAPTGAASAAAFGTASLMRLLAAAGVTTGQTFGTANIRRLLAAAGITSGQTFGVANALRLLGPAGISSAQTFGTANLVRAVAPTAIAPGGFGTPAAVRLIFPSAVATGEAFGLATVQASAPPFAPIDTNVLVSDKLLYAAQLGDALLTSAIVSDMLADTVSVSEG